MFGQGVIPSDWEGEYCRYSVCWPLSPMWLAVLRGVLIMPAQGRFWDENTGTITEAQEVIRETFDQNLHLQEVIVACSDTGLSEIAQALTLLAQASATSSSSASADCNCLGSNLQVTTNIELPDGTLWPILGTIPVPEIGPGEFPEGYEDLESYDVDKCAKATQLVDDFIASLRRMGNTNWFVGVVGAAVIAACIVGLITVPPAGIPILLFALTGNIGITALLLQLADEIESDRQDWICIFYEGDNVETITGVVSTALATAISAIGGTGAIAVALRTIALVLVSSDTLSALFTAKAIAAYPAGDCSSCGDCELEALSGWVLGNFGENRTVVGDYIQVEPTEDTSNNVFYSMLANFTELTSVSNVALHVVASPAQNYEVFVNVYDDIDNYPDSPTQTDSVTIATSGDVSLAVAATPCVAIRVVVREEPAVAPTDFDYARFSAFCVTP